MRNLVVIEIRGKTNRKKKEEKHTWKKKKKE